MATVITPRTQEFIDAHREEEPALLALKASRFPEVDMPLALSQIDGYQRAKTKIPSWAEKRGIIYPVHLSMEQCSSQQSALFKARVVECVCEKRGTFVDLTGGFGVDTAFVAPLFKKGVYVERQQELVSLAEHNFPLLGLDHVEMIHSDCLNYLEGMGKVNLIMLDPARRDGNGGRCVAMEDCTPSLTDIQERVLQCADHVLVKLSPMLDLTLALKSLRGVERIYLLSIDNECKEFLILMGHNPLPLSEIPIECVNIMRGQPEEFCFCKSEESGASPLYAEALEGYLYEPNASILKGGAYKSVAVRFALKKLHQNTHLYTSEFCLDNFPGRVFQVLACGGLGKSSVMSLLGSTDRANVAVRNFPLSVRELKKRLNLADGGEEYIYVTTLGPSSKHILVRMRRVGCHQFPNQCGSVAE